MLTLFKESQDRIASLQWSTKQEKLLVSGPLKIHIGPTYDKYVEWGFFDGSVRFFMAESKKVSLVISLNNSVISNRYSSLVSLNTFI